ncbi:GFA family protein [Hyphomonas sp.]|uniref:GFA family protein n=1 Tax=Hyphomonas sp. TaxID=87 RepID=UPI0032420B84
MLRTEISRPPLPAIPIEGGCHCGAVRYRITARPKAVNACHCDDCKRLSGATFGVYLHVPKDALAVKSGTFDVFRRTGGSGHTIPIERCRACGTRMWHLPEAAPDLVILCAGTLDDPSWAVPTSHIFTEEAARDAVAANDALVIEAFNSTRQALWAHFAQIYST